MQSNRFTQQAQEVLQRSQELLGELRHNQLDTEHIFLALLQQPEGLVPKVLDKLGVDGELMRRRVGDALDRVPEGEPELRRPDADLPHAARPAPDAGRRRGGQPAQG